MKMSPTQSARLNAMVDLPSWIGSRNDRTMLALQRRGWAEPTIGSDTTLWVITPAGRAALSDSAQS